MEAIDLVMGEDIHLLLQKTQREEMAGDVNHAATPLIARPVLDIADGQQVSLAELADGLCGIEEARGVGISHPHRVGRDMESVVLLAMARPRSLLHQDDTLLRIESALAKDGLLRLRQQLLCADGSDGSRERYGGQCRQDSISFHNLSNGQVMVKKYCTRQSMKRRVIFS